MNAVIKVAALAVGVLAAAEAVIGPYIYSEAIKRSKAKNEKNKGLAETDMAQYMPIIEKRKEYLLLQPHKDIFIRSQDGLKLHATYFPGNGGNRLVICFHGHKSEGMNDYTGLSDYYLKRGFRMLLLDARAHGKSEGTYIGFGCLDRLDVLDWIHWCIGECGEDVNIFLHGISMGGATVLMTSGLSLPKQVKGIVSDCAFTSAKELFSTVMRSKHMPSFLMLRIVDGLTRKKAGYGLDECNALREVRKAEVQILFIHGDADTFVPYHVCEKMYDNCASEKKILIVKGAAHAESYYKDMAAYEKALDDFIKGL